jgi:hypothetical protein
MQPSTREETAFQMFGAHVRVELPAPLVAPARAALAFLNPSPPMKATPPAESPADPSQRARTGVRVSASGSGWVIESGRRRQIAATEDEAVVHLQELLLEAIAARSGGQLLFRGSIVTRGSQSVLIVGDLGATHTALAIALTALDFKIVSIGAAVFDARSLTPLPLPLAFRLESANRRALQAAGIAHTEILQVVTGELYRPRTVASAPEPTHALFPEAHAGGLSLVRPISAAAARTRLCSALIAVPESQSPFAAVAQVIRHTRGVHLSLGDLPRALEQLSRLLPRWRLN